MSSILRIEAGRAYCWYAYTAIIEKRDDVGLAQGLRVVEVTGRVRFRSWKHKQRISKCMNIDEVSEEVI